MQMIYAHRGASAYAPENTLRAFRLAADMGADGVELDIQLTRDRRLVVIHDEQTDRLLGMPGAVADDSLAQLTALPVTGGMNPTGKERVPLLVDVLALLKERGLRVNIELKNSVNPYPGMEEMCLQAVADAGMEADTLYSSFNHYSLVRVKELLPSARCGMLYECCLLRPWDYAAAWGMDALHPHFTELMVDGEVGAAHALGLEVNPWTVNSEADLRRVIDLGADRIITNHPDVGRRLLETGKTAG